MISVSKLPHAFGKPAFRTTRECPFSSTIKYINANGHLALRRRGIWRGHNWLIPEQSKEENFGHGLKGAVPYVLRNAPEFRGSAGKWATGSVEVRPKVWSALPRKMTSGAAEMGQFSHCCWGGNCDARKSWVVEANWSRFSFSLVTLLSKQRSGTSGANRNFTMQ